MQDRPEAPALLDAIAELLIKEVLPLVQKHGDDALAYKTLVSWNMLGVVSRELRSGEDLLNDEITRLHGLPELKDAATSDETNASYMQKLARVRELNQSLSDTIREKKIGPENAALWEHARQSLKEKLSISNPRFSQD
ncbi:MAG: DUF6285 domain-containing protein [bacterium]|nr:DUF6285 domain-containing protein [bacterium]